MGQLVPLPPRAGNVLHDHPVPARVDGEQVEANAAVAEPILSQETLGEPFETLPFAPVDSSQRVAARIAQRLDLGDDQRSPRWIKQKKIRLDASAPDVAPQDRIAVPQQEAPRGPLPALAEGPSEGREPVACSTGSLRLPSARRIDRSSRTRASADRAPGPGQAPHRAPDALDACLPQPHHVSSNLIKSHGEGLAGYLQ